MDDRRARLHRLLRIEHCRKQFVFNVEPAAGGFRRRFGVRNHRRNALAGKADDLVKQRGVIRIAAFDLMPRGRIEFRRRVFPGQHRAHARHCQRVVLTDRFDACMRVRRTEQLQMQEFGWRKIERVARGAADDRARRRRRHAAAASVAGFGLLDRVHAADGIFDRAIPGAAADVALERPGQILPLRLIEARGRDDHARRAEAALKTLRPAENACCIGCSSPFFARPSIVVIGRFSAR